MNNKIEKMKSKIETLIEIANDNFTGEWDKSHELRLARIDGMLDMLSILTDKKYYYDENGLHETQ